jgi:hypothetical protein
MILIISLLIILFIFFYMLRREHFYVPTPNNNRHTLYIPDLPYGDLIPNYNYNSVVIGRTNRKFDVIQVPIDYNYLDSYYVPQIQYPVNMQREIQV